MPDETATLPVPLLSDSERQQVAEILTRRANDIASFKNDLEADAGKKLGAFPGSVEMALSREITRLRKLADKVKPPRPQPEEED